MATDEKRISFDNSRAFQKPVVVAPPVEVTQTVPTAPVDVLSMIAQTFPEDTATMVAIAKAESSLNPHAVSITDKMADGRAFSYGLYQVNLTVSVVGGVDCSKAFSGRDYQAKVIDEALFAKCIKLATDPATNLATARAKYETKRGLAHWGAYTSEAYKRYL